MDADPLTILLVENNSDHAELAMHCLRKHFTASSFYHVSEGEAALDFLFRRAQFHDSQTSPRPDLILLDLRLPRVDGLSVLREIKANEQFRRITVVVLTTSRSERDVSAAADLCADGYLVKPAGLAGWSDVLQQLRTHWKGRNQQPDDRPDKLTCAGRRR